MSASDTIADVLEAIAERSAFYKGEVRRLEAENQTHWGTAEELRVKVCALEAQLEAGNRQLAQAKHQRDMARLALTDIHSRAALFRDDAENGRVEGGEAWLAVLGHTTRGLALSAQDDQPKEVS